MNTAWLDHDGLPLHLCKVHTCSFTSGALLLSSLACTDRLGSPGGGGGYLRPWGLGHPQAEGWCMGQHEPLLKLFCQAGGAVRQAGGVGALLAKMKLGSNGCGWNPVLTFQIPSASEC